MIHIHLKPLCLNCMNFDLDDNTHGPKHAYGTPFGDIDCKHRPVCEGYRRCGQSSIDEVLREHAAELGLPLPPEVSDAGE